MARLHLINNVIRYNHTPLCMISIEYYACKMACIANMLKRYGDTICDISIDETIECLDKCSKILKENRR